jgi:endoribonuclease Dicer
MSHRTIEANLDSVIIAPRVFREELATFVYRPRFKSVLFNPPPYSWEAPPSRNIIALEKVVSTLNIEDDPYVQSLRSQLATLHPGQQRTRVDQKLSKVIQKQDSYTHKGLRDFLRTAKDICYDLGTWPADWFVAKIIEQARATASPYRSILNHWQQREKDYLLDILLRIDIGPVSFDEASIASGISNKVEKLIECLGVEKGTVESLDEAFSGLVFVTRRDSVLALAAVLKHHPYTAGVFSIGCLLGSSDSSYRRAFLDITRDIVKQSQTETLSDFRIGEKNLIISTAVAEEGIDIQACGAVIRMDPPQNMVSWAQSRGRARRKESTFVLMFERDGVHQGLVEKWEGLEAQMNSRYNKEMDEEVKRRRDEYIQTSDDVFHDRTQFRVQETG